VFKYIKVLTHFLHRTYCYSGLGGVGELDVLGEGKTQLVLEELGQCVVEIILICRDADCKRAGGSIGHMAMNITSDLKFLNIHYPSPMKGLAYTWTNIAACLWTQRITLLNKLATCLRAWL